jgi:S-formylglutathione hydrolase FrmB
MNSIVRPEDRYSDYLEELIVFAGKKLNISSLKEERGICGWSMGGYGAVIFAERHANDFGTVASMIGLLDYPGRGLPKGQDYPIVTERFGEKGELWKLHNPINFAGKLAGKNILILSGEQSFDFTMNLNFSKKLKRLSIKHTFKKIPGGHTFNTVKNLLPDVIQFMNKYLVKGD